MRLIDVITAPWAIVPDRLEVITDIYDHHLRREKIDLAAVEASIGSPLNNEAKGYQVQDGVAVIAIDGVIAKRMNLFTRISGGTSSQLIQSDFAAAMADRTVEAIVLAVDSPGGAVDGTPELAQAIHAARGQKPILACTDGMMCSAAYWIGAAADSVYISSDVAMVGSIGVVAQHVDVSKAEEKMGVKTTEITAGKYKRISSQYAPLSEEGRANIQDAIDHVYSVFVDDVAKFRGVSTGGVLEGMADGRVFHGRQAVDAGLVDGVATMAETVAMARNMAREKNRVMHRPTGAVAATSTTKENHMNINTFKVEQPDLYAAIVAEAQSGMAAQQSAAMKEGECMCPECKCTDCKKTGAKAEGAAVERARIQAIEAIAIPGHESLIASLKFDGKSTAADAALAIVNAEKGFRQAAAAAIDADAPPVVPVVDAEADQAKTIKRADFNKLPAHEQAAVARSGAQIVD